MSRKLTIGKRRRQRRNRRGAIIPLSALLLVILLTFVAFAVDIGFMTLVRAQSQSAADAAALAAAQELVSEQRLRSSSQTAVFNTTRNMASQFAAMHQAGAQPIQLVPGDDIHIGRLSQPLDPTDTLTTLGSPKKYNAVQVDIKLNQARGTQLPFFFAAVLGHDGFEVEASATAAYADGIAGFRTTGEYPTTTLLPFTLNVVEWLFHQSFGSKDDYSYNDQTGGVSTGSDGVKEIKLYPIKSGSGNWGTVDIGDPNNSTADLSRQIEFGVDSSDLAYHGGELKLNSVTHSLLLTGDTGISAGMKDQLETVVGMPRSIPLYSTASGNGNNMNYTIVGFAGIRIVDVRLTGKNKYIIVQPAYTVDATAVDEDWVNGGSFYVTEPLRLVR